MKIPLEDILLLYQKMIGEINVAEVSVVLFSALDVDALCTLKILSVAHSSYRNFSRAKISSIKCTLSLPIPNLIKRSKIAAPSTKLNCFSSSIVGDLSISQQNGSTRIARYSCLMFISPSTMPTLKEETYAFVNPDTNN